MPNSTRITFYPDDETKQQIEDRAAELDMSVSTYCAEAVTRYLEEDTASDRDALFGTEDRVEMIVDGVRDEIEQAATEVEHQQATAALYSVATWELIATRFKPPERTDAMTTARQQLEDINDSLPDTGASGTDSAAGQPAENAASGTESTPAADDDAEAAESGLEWDFDKHDFKE